METESQNGPSESSRIVVAFRTLCVGFHHEPHAITKRRFLFAHSTGRNLLCCHWRRSRRLEAFWQRQEGVWAMAQKPVRRGFGCGRRGLKGLKMGGIRPKRAPHPVRR